MRRDFISLRNTKKQWKKSVCSANDDYCDDSHWAQLELAAHNSSDGVVSRCSNDRGYSTALHLYNSTLACRLVRHCNSLFLPISNRTKYAVMANERERDIRIRKCQSPKTAVPSIRESWAFCMHRTIESQLISPRKIRIVDINKSCSLIALLLATKCYLIWDKWKIVYLLSG